LAVYGDRSEHEANQGDIFEDVQLEGPWKHEAMVMLISHDCDCDKYLKPKVPLTESERDAWRVTIAEVQLLGDLHTNRRVPAEKNEMPRYLPLPAEGEHPAMVVDLWTEQPLRFLDLLKCKRKASLSPEWREQLWWKIVRLRLGKDFRAILEGKVPPDAA
jgi:hypothetical protein